MKSLFWFRYLVPKDEETEPGFKAEIDRLSLIGLRAIAAVCIGATAMMFLIGSILYHGEVKEWIFPLTDLTVMSIGVAALALSYSRRASGWGRLGGSLVGCVNNGRLQSVFDEAVRSGRQSSERLRDAVQRLKQLTSLDRADEQMVDLNEVWSDTVTFLRTELEAKADVSMDLPPLPRVKCRPQQLSAVFSNLLRNAAAAIPERGKIAITSDRRGEELVFRVKDNGRGIPPAQLEHLFEPAFRVEGSRVATSNWGLFVSRGIIADHGGHLYIESAEGEGTTATIQLPLPT